MFGAINQRGEQQHLQMALSGRVSLRKSRTLFRAGEAWHKPWHRCFVPRLREGWDINGTRRCSSAQPQKLSPALDKVTDLEAFQRPDSH